ncbi:hypothetical protein BDQ17DRAFT_1433898 [Cyathus striatus]|nr:hypothetical protein BDQ17DRAFT_1433898 [Cyathus striatus]
MLALLNHRERFREIANETIPLETMMRGQTTSTSDLDQENPVHSHPPELDSCTDIVNTATTQSRNCHGI